MKYDPVKFRFDRNTHGLSVIPDPVYTDIDFGAYRISLRKIEGYDICIEIMGEKLAVNFQERLVCAKNIVDGSEL